MQKQQQQEPTAEVQPPVPAYNLQHAFITYGDLRANIIEAADVLDNNHVIPSNISRDGNRRNSSSITGSSSSSLSSFNILSTTMRYCVYAVLEVCQDDNYNNCNNNNDEVNDEVKVQENKNDDNNTIEEKMLMMNRTTKTTTTTLNNINIVSTNRIQCNRNEPLSIREEFVFQNISSVYHFIIKFYVTSWSASNDSTTNSNSIITTTLKSIQKNSYDHHHHHNDDDDSHTVCIGFTRIPLYRLQENQTVSCM